MPTHVRYDKERQNQANKFKAEDVQAGDPRHDIQKIQSNTKHPYSKTKKKKGSVERGRKRKKREEQGRNKGGKEEKKVTPIYNITDYWLRSRSRLERWMVR